MRTAAALLSFLMACGGGGDGLLPKGKPALPEALKQYEPGMSEQAYRALPRPPWDLGGGIRFFVGVDTDRHVVEDVALHLSTDKAKSIAMVQAAWGPGQEDRCLLGVCDLFWFNPDTDLRVSLTADGRVLTFTRYIPADKLITTLLAHGGQTVAELRARYPHLEGADGLPVLMLPPTERGNNPTYVGVEGADGKVRGLRGLVPYGDLPQVKAELHARLARAGGDKVKIEDDAKARGWRFAIATL